jgi:hypothetical protein
MAIIVVFVAGLFCGTFISQAIAAQTHMDNALAALNRAYNQLDLATPDKAGHRVKAMGLVQDAIGETKLGIAAGAGM